jgi:hypothetical protein
MLDDSAQVSSLSPAKISLSVEYAANPIVYLNEKDLQLDFEGNSGFSLALLKTDFL